MTRCPKISNALGGTGMRKSCKIELLEIRKMTCLRAVISAKYLQRLNWNRLTAGGMLS